MQNNFVYISFKLVQTGVLKPFMSTSEAVKFLDNKKYHRKKITKPEFSERLGRRRKGKSKKHFEFSTLKIIEFANTTK